MNKVHTPDAGLRDLTETAELSPAIFWEMPDWKTGSYPDPEDTRMRMWAWEFLRRNPSYREDWLTNPVGRNGLLWWRDYNLVTPLDPRAEYIEPEFVFEIPLGQSPLVAEVFDIRKDIDREWHRVKKLLQQRAKSFHTSARAAATATATKRAHRKHYSRYLRILDARECGADNRSISRVISEHEGKKYYARDIKDNLKAANTLRDEGFTWMPFWRSEKEK